MAAILRQTPINSSEFAAGTGLLISTLRRFEDPEEEPNMVLRFILRDPDNLGNIDIGVPLYQMTMVRSFVKDLVLGPEPEMIVLLHCDKIKKIITFGAFSTGNVVDSKTFMVTYADLSAVDHAVSGGGYAMASVSVPEPALEPSTHYVTSVLSVPSVADKLGVTLLPLIRQGHVVAAAADVSGTTLGFSGSQLTDWRWTGFVATRSESNSDHIIVMGGLEKLDVVRRGTGDLSGSANYVFTLRESDGGLETAAVQVSTDIPFTPHQLVSGRPNNASDSTFWCIGRVDPEFVNPFNMLKMPSVDAANSLTLAGSIGIWSSKDPGLRSFTRVWESPLGVSSPPIHHLDNAVVPHSEVTRDLGLLYVDLNQRLIPFVIDTDSGQDPVTETPRRSEYDFVPS